MATELAAAGFEGLDAADNEAIFKSDAFRMQHMKVLPCSKRFVHDWTECPFAHPQEKARRRDPRVHNYTGIACPSMKKEGCCAFGDHCPYAHNVFEYWLHPTRYRTQLCNDGSNCKRKICFFAHSLDELRVPACKPFVSPEALASAAASAAADAEAKRKAATIGSPLSAFAALSPGPSPQRSSLDALRAASLAAEVRLSGASVVAPHSPATADEMAAPPGTPHAEAAVHATLAQLAGAGFTAQDQQVIELVTGLLAQDKVTPEQAATILQQMLPPGTLSQLQAHLTTPRGAEEGRYSDPLSPAATMRGGSFEGASSAPSALAGSPARQLPQQPAGLTMEQVAAVQAAHSLGMGYSGGPSLASHSLMGHMGQEAPRQSMDSLRSSFDTGAAPPAPRSCRSSSNSSTGTEPGGQSLAEGGKGVGEQVQTAPAQARGAGQPDQQQAQQHARQPQQHLGLQQQTPRVSAEAALQRASLEEGAAAASQKRAAQQQAALHAAQQHPHQHALLHALLAPQPQQRGSAAVEAALQQRRHLLQLHTLQQHLLQQQQAAAGGQRPSEDSTRMSFEMGGRGSMDMLGTPRTSLDATYPSNLVPTLSGSLSGQFSSGQLSSVPEGFPIINAPPPSSSWGAGRFSVDSAADRLSEDLNRLSFEGAARAAPNPTANPYASSFFAPGATAAAALGAGMADRRSLSLPPLPPVRTSAPGRSAGHDQEEAAAIAAANAAAHHHQQLLGGTAMHRLQ